MGRRGPEPAPFVLMLQLCTAYPQDSRNVSRSHREPALLGPARSTPCVSVSQHTLVSSVNPYNWTPLSCNFASIIQGWEIREGGGVYERIQYADVEAKKANCNDEAEGAQTEIHRGLANEGAEPAGSRPCCFTAAAVWHVTLAVAGCASLTDRRRHFTERTPQCAAYVRPQTLDANRGHSDKEWCGYISVRILKPAQSLIWLKYNCDPLPGSAELCRTESRRLTMSLQTAVDVWTASYIKSREASLVRLMGALSPPDKQRQRAIAILVAAIAAAKRHRAAWSSSG